MKQQFWLDRWESGEIGFHQADVHDFLKQHWKTLALPPGSFVFVPLCGKSSDMVWLAERGHRVIGVELSPIAVEQFFEEQGIEAVIETKGDFTVTRGGPYEIWCGDLFLLPREALSSVAAVYDRASLVAMPPSMQHLYVAKITDLVSKTAPWLLVSLAYPEGQITGPPFSTPLLTLVSLFGPTHTIALVETRNGLETSQNLKDRGVTALEEALYLMRRS